MGSTATAAATAATARHRPRLLPVFLFIAASIKARISHRVLLYRRGGDRTVTGNVTWLSPAACDPGGSGRLTTVGHRRRRAGDAGPGDRGRRGAGHSGGRRAAPGGDGR